MMKMEPRRSLLSAALGVALVLASAPSVAGNKVEVSKYGKVLTPAKLRGGTNIQTGDAPNLRVEMVQVKGAEDYLLRFTGVDHDDDGKVLRYTRAPAGADAFYYSRDGKNRLREERADVVVYTLYANNKEFKLVVDAAETQKLDVGKLVKDLK